MTSYHGSEVNPALSPDGKQVAFSWNGEKEDNYDIYVKLADAGDPVRLTTNAADDDSPAWSPDGRFIAFVRSGASRTRILRGSGAGWTRAQSGRYTSISDARPADHRGLVPRREVACDHRYERPASSAGFGFRGRWAEAAAHVAFSDQLRRLRASILTRRAVAGFPACSWRWCHEASRAADEIGFHSRGGTQNTSPRGANGGHGLDPPGAPTVGRLVYSRSGELWHVGVSGTAEPVRLVGTGNNVSWPSIARQGRRMVYVQSFADGQCLAHGASRLTASQRE